MKHSNKIDGFKTFCTMPPSCIIKRRFFSEYAALQRVSHHQFLVSIKDFSYLKQCVYLVFSFFSFFKKPWECYTGKAVHASIINSAISALSRSINSTHTHTHTPSIPSRPRSPRNNRLAFVCESIHHH